MCGASCGNAGEAWGCCKSQSAATLTGGIALPPSGNCATLTAMNSHPMRTLLAAALCCAVASCSSVSLPKWAKRKPVPKAVPIRFPKTKSDGTKGKPKAVGTILLVNADAGFVLIDSHGWALPEVGTALKCLRDGV